MKMIIMRGKAGSYALPGEKARVWPRGALDDQAAVEFAKLRGYVPKIIDVAGYSAVDSKQMQTAMSEIRADNDVFALYGFSAGGYTILNILGRLTRKEKDRLALVVVLGAPEAGSHSYNGPWELIYRLDPSKAAGGHMGGPRELLKQPYGPAIATRPASP
jgi:hypothetical protein